jgi:glyoxylase-like metal-dependent hydrolase (beta-lactamase superfamily II)
MHCVTAWWVALAVLLVSAGWCGAGKPIALSDEVQLEPIETGAWMVVHRFAGGNNSLLVRCDERRFVWVDTPCTDEATRLVHEWLGRTFDEPNVIEINTGFHNDNLGGNGYLLGQGVPCHGSDITPRLIAECWAETVRKVLPYFEGEANKKYRDILVKQKLVAPNRLYPLAEGLTLKVGPETVEVHFPGPSHTVDNVVVYFPSRRLLFGGCMVKALASRTPGFTGDADMRAWPVSVREVLARYPDARVVVPGHGRWGDLSLLRHTIELLEEYNRQHP